MSGDPGEIAGGILLVLLVRFVLFGKFLRHEEEKINDRVLSYLGFDKKD